jgi:hypothetical protein
MNLIYRHLANLKAYILVAAIAAGFCVSGTTAYAAGSITYITFAFGTQQPGGGLSQNYRFMIQALRNQGIPFTSIRQTNINALQGISNPGINVQRDLIGLRLSATNDQQQIRNLILWFTADDWYLRGFTANDGTTWQFNDSDFNLLSQFNDDAQNPPNRWRINLKLWQQLQLHATAGCKQIGPGYQLDGDPWCDFRSRRI